MAGNTFGNLFRVTTFGESHGPALGVVIDGCPSGIALDEADLAIDLLRRRPGQSAVTTARVESDVPRIVSGVFEGRTTGVPIAVWVLNEDARSADYEALRDHPRPGHADETYAAKYENRDHRGGGRSSGRETLSRVIAGSIAKKVLPDGVRVIAHAQQIGPHVARRFDAAQIERNLVRCADPQVAAEMVSYIEQLKEAGDSTGGVVEIRVQGAPKSLGEPVFLKLKACLAHAVMSVGAVTGFAYGRGFETGALTGSEYIADRSNFGGILGGLSTGEEIRLLASVKPTTSIGALAKQGRHDPCIVPRVIPVLEAMVWIVLADLYLLHRSSASDSMAPTGGTAG